MRQKNQSPSNSLATPELEEYIHQEILDNPSCIECLHCHSVDFTRINELLHDSNVPTINRLPIGVCHVYDKVVAYSDKSCVHFNYSNYDHISLKIDLDNY